MRSPIGTVASIEVRAFPLLVLVGRLLQNEFLLRSDEVIDFRGGGKPLQPVLEIIETLAVVIGVVFGLIQLRQLRHQREVQAGLELLAPLQTPESVESLLLIHDLPDGLDGAQLKARLGRNYRATVGMLGLFESLGPIVARGHIPIDMYAEFYRGPTLLCWRKFRRFIEEERNEGWSSLFEWLQWLAERMEERPKDTAGRPAYQRFAQWKKARDFYRLSRSA